MIGDLSPDDLYCGLVDCARPRFLPAGLLAKDLWRRKAKRAERLIRPYHGRPAPASGKTTAVQAIRRTGEFRHQAHLPAQETVRRASTASFAA